jgi:hypothetical protein
MDEASPPDERRDKFLLAMYREVWNNINRHMTVVWQSASVLAGAFALFALVDKGTFNIDVASMLLVVIAGWLVAHTYDSDSWFARNLVIIANIERQFLRPSDAHDIHFFFLEHRKAGDMVGHFRVHWALGVVVAIIVLSYHFVTRVRPFLGPSWVNFEMQRSLPYIAAIVCTILVWQFRKRANEHYMDLVKRSPGARISEPE